MLLELDCFDIGQIAESGQCFRMKKQEDGSYLVIANDRAIEVHQWDNTKVEFRCSQEAFNGFWRQYFDLDEDYMRFIQAVPSDDQFLQEAIHFGRGLRILRQDLWEMMVSFIISQNNNIPRIQGSIEQLCARFGKERTLDNGKKYYAFPTQEELKQASIADLRNMGLGYRDQYVYALARMPLPIKELQGMGWQEAHKLLTSFLGIGPKVAHCICLFGLHHMEAFPVDTWIRKTIAAHYNGVFPLERYDGFAGVIQQYMFYYGRSGNAKKS